MREQKRAVSIPIQWKIFGRVLSKNWPIRTITKVLIPFELKWVISYTLAVFMCAHTCLCFFPILLLLLLPLNLIWVDTYNTDKTEYLINKSIGFNNINLPYFGMVHTLSLSHIKSNSFIEIWNIFMLTFERRKTCLFFIFIFWNWKH